MFRNKNRAAEIFNMFSFPVGEAPLLRKRGISQILSRALHFPIGKACYLFASISLILFHCSTETYTVRKSLKTPGVQRPARTKTEKTLEIAFQKESFLWYLEPHFWINWSNNEPGTFRGAWGIIRLEVTEGFFWSSQAPSFDSR